MEQLNTYQFGANMDTIQILRQIFQRNLDNRLTVELCNGMLQEIASLIPVIKEVEAPPQAQQEE